MLGNTILYVVDRFCTFDRKLALAYANALQEWSTTIDCYVTSHSSKVFSNYEYLDSYLVGICFTWTYDYIKAWYDVIDDSVKYNQTGWMRGSQHKIEH